MWPNLSGMDVEDNRPFRLVEEYDPALGQRVAKLWLPLLELWHRARFEGLDNVPDGAFLAVGNHTGVHFMPESFLWLCKYHTLPTCRPMYALTHDFLCRVAEKLNFPMHAFGILEASSGGAYEALTEGCAVTVYPGGDRDNSKPFCQRNTIDFFGHTGYAKLALKARVAVVPIVGVGGGETVFTLTSGEKLAQLTGLSKWLKIHTWPVYWSFPFGWHVGHIPALGLPLPSQVTISVLPPISTEFYPENAHNDPDAVTELDLKVRLAMQAETDRLVAGRVPVLGKLG